MDGAVAVDDIHAVVFCEGGDTDWVSRLEKRRGTKR